ncbi:DUF1206 domain-containing protein [Consotaella aegiceratis]|uniref:DUF1206 domain-containing protein n=1 Tax=Consotaella aegiceratis TaxID=3097961 RepID=UPI002F407BC5
MIARQAIRSGTDMLETLARGGYAARGLVFLIIGYFAFRAAFATGRAMDSKDAIEQIFGSTFGGIMICALVVALVAFSLWRFGQSLLDVDDHGTGAKGLAVRAGLFGSAITYGALAFYAASIVIGYGSSSDGGSGGLVAKAYEAGFGRAATYLIGAVFAGVGGAHIVKGAKAGFMKYMSIPERYCRWLKPVCQFGLIARGMTFLVIALLLFTGAASYREGDSPGLRAALEAMDSWPFGWLLLSLTGLGLIAFGLYGITEAFFRRVELDE